MKKLLEVYPHLAQEDILAHECVVFRVGWIKHREFITGTINNLCRLTSQLEAGKLKGDRLF